MKDYDGDEDDGYDETIYPVDHTTYGQIVDDVCIISSLEGATINKCDC